MFWLTASEAMVSQHRVKQTNSPALLKKGRLQRSRTIMTILVCEGPLRATDPGVPAATWWHWSCEVHKYGQQWPGMWVLVTWLQGVMGILCCGSNVFSKGSFFVCCQPVLLACETWKLLVVVLIGFKHWKKSSAPTNWNVCLFLPALSLFSEPVTTLIQRTIPWDYLDPENELSHEMCILHNPLFARNKDRRD